MSFLEILGCIAASFFIFYLGMKAALTYQRDAIDDIVENKIREYHEKTH